MRHTLFSILAFTTLLVAGLSLSGCADNEDNTPSYADTDRMEALIDKDIEKIVQFKNNYGTYILYNFQQDLDFAYQFEQATNWNDAKLTSINHNDAAVAVDWLYENVFNCYSDDYKSKLFPRKLLLVSEINSNQELGLSIPANSKHSAVANMNSVTFAGVSAENIAKLANDEPARRNLIANMHRALLADYLVKARREQPVEDAFYNYSATYYSSLMDSKRRNAKTLGAEDPNFFSDRGFFFPADDESTYFPSLEDDVIAYICTMVSMNEKEADSIMTKTIMANKMHILAVGLQNIGINVTELNGNAEQFLNMNPIIPAAVMAPNVLTQNSEATLPVTIMRGSQLLNYLKVKVNGTDYQRIDLKRYFMNRISIPLSLSGLSKGVNIVTLELFEEDSEVPSQRIDVKAIYASIDNISGFKGEYIEGDKTTQCKIKFSEGTGGDVDPNEKNPNLTTISFENSDWTPDTYNEPNCNNHYWKVYKENDVVVRIEEYKFEQKDIFSPPTYPYLHTYFFTYNSANELQNVEFSPAEGAPSTLIGNIRYENGRIASYNYNGTPYEAKYATAEGLTTRIDCLDGNMSGMCFSFNGTEPRNNTFYRPEIPAVIPGFVADVPLQLLYSEYIFNSLGNTWTSNWNYVTDGNAMAIETHITINGKEWTYRFVLKTDE